jgi:hypothetical protein
MQKTMAPFMGERGTCPSLPRFGAVILDARRDDEASYTAFAIEDSTPHDLIFHVLVNDADLKVFFEKPINLDWLRFRRQEGAGFEGILANAVDF